ARWVQIDEGALFHDLEALGEASGPDARRAARLLFARVLDATGGGLRIQTIHSFCQSLLAAFPLEAGLVPGFRPLDERAQAALSRTALIGMIEDAERQFDQPLLDAMAMLALRLGEQGTVDYLARCVPAGPALDALPEDIAGALLDFLELPTGDLDAHPAACCADPHIPEAALRRLAHANRAWNTKTGLALAECIARWLGSAAHERPAQIAALLSGLVTKDGEVKNRNNEKLLAHDAGYIDIA